MQQNRLDQVENLGVLILDYAEVDHGDDRRVAIGQHFDVWKFSAGLLRHLQHLRDAGKVRSGTGVPNSRLKTSKRVRHFLAN